MARLQVHVMSNVPHESHQFTSNGNNDNIFVRSASVELAITGTKAHLCFPCFRTRKYVEAYCRTSNYLQTMTNQGYNLLVAIQSVLSGQIYADMGEWLPPVKLFPCHLLTAYMIAFS